MRTRPTYVERVVRWPFTTPRGQVFLQAGYHALSIVGLIVLILLLGNPNAHGIDARGYWSFDPQEPYREAMGNLSAQTAFRYAPPIALAFMPFQALPWVPWITGWTLVLVAGLVFLGRWSALAALALYPVAMELSAGNVNILIGAAVVLGFRWPATWAFVLLTKITPGVGLVWFVVRREWRSLAIALGATALLSLVAHVIRPDLFVQWFAMLRSDLGAVPEGHHLPIPLWIRVLAAAVLVAWGARTNRRWTVVVGATLALPTIWLAGLSVLLGLITLQLERATGWPGHRAEEIASSEGGGLGEGQAIRL